MASKQFAEVLGLHGVFGGEIELVEFGQAVDQAADFDAEHVVEFLARDGRVLDRVVQHGGDDGRVVQLELGENRGDFERVREIGIARGALLRAVRLHREHIGAIQQILVGLRIVAPHALHQFVLPHHCKGARLLGEETGTRISNIRIAWRARKGLARKTGSRLPFPVRARISRARAGPGRSVRAPIV